MTTSASSTGSASTSTGQPMCGNGIVESPETCDGDCPVECIDPNLCTSEVPAGTECDLTCDFKPLIACKSGDGCCPMGCFNGNDRDCAQKILLLSAVSDSEAASVKSALGGTGAFGSVDSINYLNNAPVTLTLAQLTPYSSVLVYNSHPFSDPAKVGDVLADYVDQGGRAVLSTAANCADQYRIRGRFESDGYFLNDDGGALATATNIDPTFNEPMSPLVVGVTPATVNAHCDLTAAPGVTVVASFVDGRPLILRGKRKGRNRVDLNLFVDSGTSSTLGDVIVNALQYPL
ncbi:MAG: hypothetical protein U0414_19700 [Polyangiaceae bacterium]